MQLFSEQGFHGTSTREIAEAAGVNEALIFRHFPTKEDLFWAVLSEKLGVMGWHARLSGCFDLNQNEADVLSAVAARLLDRTREDTALTRLLLFAALHGDLSDRLFRTYLTDTYELVAQYVRDGVRRGRFRNVDPMVAARAFLGMIVYHHIVQELLGGERYQQFVPEELGPELADILLNGISAAGAERGNGNRSRRHARREGAEAIAVGNAKDNGQLE